MRFNQTCGLAAMMVGVILSSPRAQAAPASQPCRHPADHAVDVVEDVDVALLGRLGEEGEVPGDVVDADERPLALVGFVERLAVVDGEQDVAGLAAWKQRRPQLYREFMHSMSLDPLPPKCDLDVQVAGELKGRGFHLKKLFYRIWPDCWAGRFC